jgi:hypothetical protein
MIIKLEEIEIGVDETAKHAVLSVTIDIPVPVLPSAIEFGNITFFLQDAWSTLVLHDGAPYLSLTSVLVKNDDPDDPLVERIDEIIAELLANRNVSNLDAHLYSGNENEPSVHIYG